MSPREWALLFAGLLGGWVAAMVTMIWMLDRTRRD